MSLHPNPDYLSPFDSVFGSLSLRSALLHNCVVYRSAYLPGFLYKWAALRNTLVVLSSSLSQQWIASQLRHYSRVVDAVNSIISRLLFCLQLPLRVWQGMRMTRFVFFLILSFPTSWSRIPYEAIHWIRSVYVVFGWTGIRFRSVFNTWLEAWQWNRVGGFEIL